jgi:chemotaxis protein methyltransferase CheR
MSSITAEEFNVLSKYIYSVCGVSLDATKTYLVETRLKSMMQKYVCASYMDLYSKVKADRSGTMEKEVVNAITTNETLFFRDASPFEVFKHKILPDLVDARSKANPGRPVPIRIWSAACSTGQEVYSVAIALKEALGSSGNFQISILGTDISDDAITRASYGKYNKFEIERGLPPQTLNRYFTLMGDGWKIKDEIRAMAVFKKFNLMKPFTGMGKFDVVFCRNVAIYFTPADKRSVFEKIAGVMEPDGSLIIGSTESLTGVTEVFETRRYMRSIFYQPRGAGGAARASASPAPAASLQRPAAVGFQTAAPPRQPMAPPRPAPVAAPAGAGSPAPPKPQVAAPAPPAAQPGGTAAPIPAPTAPPEPRSVQAPPPADVPGMPEPAPQAPAPPRREPLRHRPAQTYRAGDKSDLKRLLMQKKQKTKA